MNDLWTSLSNLRGTQSTQSVNHFAGAMQASLQAVVPQLNRVLESLGKTK